MKHKQIKHTNWYEQYIDLINKGLSQRKACKEMCVPRSTIQHWLADRMVCDAIIEDHKEVIDETAYLLSTPNEMIEVIEHLNNKQEVEDDKFKDWSDWDAACGVMSPPELLQGDTVIYMIGDGAISVQKVGRLSWKIGRAHV